MENQIGHIGPALKGRARKCLAFAGEGFKIIADDVIAARVPAARAFVTPIAVDQVIRNLIQRVDGRAAIFMDRESV